ncbi:MAG: B12-binding domain-containing radical SAM protein [Candidatus Helarchaeota archaeon]
MNTILIYPRLEFAKAQTPTLPFSIIFLADYLFKRSINVNIFDLRHDSPEQVLNNIAEKEPEYVGISVMTGPQIFSALLISKLIKQNFKNVKIVWGGIHPTILPEQTLRNNMIDFIIRGEGERSYFELISGRNKSQISGLSMKKDQRILHNQENNLMSSSDLNELCIPWDLIEPERYIENGNFNMITSRGCPFKCAFCYNALLNNQWRGWTAEKCKQELDKAVEFGAKKILFYDDNFFANMKRIKSLFSYFKERGIIWKAELRVDMIKYSLAKEAKKCGCAQMYFGAESGSPRILRILNKQISPSDIIRSAKITRELDLIADYSWMIGIPGETKNDIKKTLSLIKKVKKVNPDCEFSIKILYPYPKTPIYEKAIKLGFKPPNNLLDWAKIRRERAPNYLKNRNLLEMISITSAIVGRQVFEQLNFPPIKILKYIANSRWKKEFFGFGVENIFFKIFRDKIEKSMDKETKLKYDPFLRKMVSVKKSSIKN